MEVSGVRGRSGREISEQRWLLVAALALQGGKCAIKAKLARFHLFYWEIFTLSGPTELMTHLRNSEKEQLVIHYCEKSDSL